MVLRIEQIADESETIFRLIGRITSPDVQQAEISRTHELAYLHGTPRRSAARHPRVDVLEKPRVGELDGDGPRPMDA